VAINSPSFVHAIEYGDIPDLVSRYLLNSLSFNSNPLSPFQIKGASSHLFIFAAFSVF